MASISEDQLLTARIVDAVAWCDKHNYPHFIGFLDERQRHAAEPIVQKAPVSPLFWGGYPEAERTLLGVFPASDPPDTTLFPLTPLSFVYRDFAALSHRDFLGALLAQGVRREKIGDILCSPGYAVAFVSEEISSHLCAIDQVGREGVKVVPGLLRGFTFERQYQTVQATVASPRVDNVVKALAGFSREKAAEAIAGDRVALNHLPCTAVAKTVCEGDVLSIRGIGRFRVTALSAHTKKGRILLVAQKYL